MLNEAIKIAKELPQQKQRIACIITDKRGRIVSKGRNFYLKSHPLQAHYAKQVGYDKKIYLHAEIDALIRAKGKGYAIHIARVSPKGEPLISSPCPICSLALQEAGIKEIHHTF